MPRAFHQMPDLYGVLGIDVNATIEDVKRAYRRSALQHHPDKKPCGENVDAAEFQKASIQEAYEILGNPDTRARYDRQRGTSSTPHSATHANDGESERIKYRYKRSRAYARAVATADEAAGHRAKSSEYAYPMDPERKAKEEAWSIRIKAIERAQGIVKWMECMIDEEEKRDGIIDSEHQSHMESGEASSVSYGKKCWCGGCYARFVREGREEDERKEDPQRYAERLKVRAEISARKANWFTTREEHTDALRLRLVRFAKDLFTRVGTRYGMPYVVGLDAKKQITFDHSKYDKVKKKNLDTCDVIKGSE
ncbi:hypothetical protein N0V90_008580 [Kalmusia sp. IMI 367209]|nr:hypothetical protein N0V90_008580 [Kalmusia sp. IMI 367209]